MYSMRTSLSSSVRWIPHRYLPIEMLQHKNIVVELPLEVDMSLNGYGDVSGDRVAHQEKVFPPFRPGVCEVKRLLGKRS